MNSHQIHNVEHDSEAGLCFAHNPHKFSHTHSYNNKKFRHKDIIGTYNHSESKTITKLISCVAGDDVLIPFAVVICETTEYFGSIFSWK